MSAPSGHEIGNPSFVVSGPKQSAYSGGQDACMDSTASGVASAIKEGKYSILVTSIGEDEMRARYEEMFRNQKVQEMPTYGSGATTSNASGNNYSSNGSSNTGLPATSHMASRGSPFPSQIPPSLSDDDPFGLRRFGAIDNSVFSVTPLSQRGPPTCIQDTVDMWKIGRSLNARTPVSNATGAYSPYKRYVMLEQTQNSEQNSVQSVWGEMKSGFVPSRKMVSAWAQCPEALSHLGATGIFGKLSTPIDDDMILSRHPITRGRLAADDNNEGAYTFIAYQEDEPTENRLSHCAAVPQDNSSYKPSAPTPSSLEDSSHPWETSYLASSQAGASAPSSHSHFPTVRNIGSLLEELAVSSGEEPAS